MAEWSKAAVLKTADREVRGFESLSLRQPAPNEADELFGLVEVDGAEGHHGTGVDVPLFVVP